MPTKQNTPAPPGYALNEALLRAKKSGRWLAQKIQTNDPQMSRYRNGLRPSEEMQDRIADALSDELGRKVTPKELGW